ncbi:MAG TPA: prephenate dehydratase [Acidimicrobiales bacterium]|nr:prephenate dehydratase [Acidimicrobiales bacterium]
MSRIAYLGPPGTFTEEALLSQPDLADGELIPVRALPDVLAAVESGECDQGFIPIENSIDGTVSLSLDSIVFDYDLLIQREVVLNVHLNLLAPPGVTLADVRRVVSFPPAIAQCRGFLADKLPDVEVTAANSTSEAVEQVGAAARVGTRDAAAVGTALAGRLYGLDVLEADVADHPENQTRFLLMEREGVPAPTGHDKTSIVCFQHADRPGSLHAILGQFSARNLNLTKLESRPTKRGLGDYCFIIDLEGHVDDEVVADCLRDLHAQLAGLKFLGSYPAAGEHGPAIRRDAEESWRSADEWITTLRSQVRR